MTESQVVQEPPPRRRRWGLWIFLIVVVIVVFLGVMMAIGLASLMKGPTVEVMENSTLVIDLQLPMQEMPPDPVATELFKAKILTVYDLNLALQKAAKDTRIKSVLIKVGMTPAGFAKMQEFRSYLETFKKSKKPVWAYFEIAGNGGYYLASMTDKICAPPSSMLLLTGLKAEIPFYRGALEKVHVEPQLFHIGDYKSYSDIFMNKEMTEAHREATNSLLDSLYGQIRDGIAESRGIEKGRIDEIINRGFLWGEGLRENGLVDELWYQDQVEEGLMKVNGNTEKWNHVDVCSYFKDKTVDPYAGSKSTVGLVIASGGIVSGSGGKDNIGSDTTVKHLRKMGKDDSVKAVVFRVDSGGGSAVASDMILRQVQKLRKDNKPVVVSMSDVAASGGYWISMDSDGIVAQPGTITGSIGVVTGKFFLGGFWEWIGINHEIIKRGDNADLFSPLAGFSDDQAALIQAEMKSVYDDFVNKVAQGRGKTYDEIHRIGQGRVWTGEQSIENGLIDRLGGIREAIQLAKEKAGIPEGDKVRIRVLPKPMTLMEAIFDTGVDDLARARTEAQIPPELLEAYRTYQSIRPLTAEPIVAYTPVRVRID